MSLDMNACDIHGSSGSSISVESVIANHSFTVIGHVPGWSNSAGIFNKSGRVLYVQQLISRVWTLNAALWTLNAF
jgi:hypothetical protein